MSNIEITTAIINEIQEYFTTTEQVETAMNWIKFGIEDNKPISPIGKTKQEILINMKKYF